MENLGEISVNGFRPGCEGCVSRLREPAFGSCRTGTHQTALVRGEWVGGRKQEMKKKSSGPRPASSQRRKAPSPPVLKHRSSSVLLVYLQLQSDCLVLSCCKCPRFKHGGLPAFSQRITIADVAPSSQDGGCEWAK